MLNTIITAIQKFLLTIFRLPELVTVFIAIVPIVEARLAIPMAVDMGINVWLGGLYAFLGSIIIAPLLLLFLLPFINWLSRTKLFKKVGNVIYEKFEKKSRSIASAHPAKPVEEMTQDELLAFNKAKKKLEFKKMIGVFVFVAIPMPLTGVWTGCAVAAIAKLSYPKALVSILLGNLVACFLITLLSALFASYIDIIILIISLIAIAVVIALIIKIAISKPKQEN